MKPTAQRRYHDQGHRPPMSGVDHAGNPWQGASRIVDRAGRRRRNRASYRRLLTEARREYVARKGERS